MEVWFPCRDCFRNAMTAIGQVLIVLLLIHSVLAGKNQKCSCTSSQKLIMSHLPNCPHFPTPVPGLGSQMPEKLLLTIDSWCYGSPGARQGLSLPSLHSLEGLLRLLRMFPGMTPWLTGLGDLLPHNDQFGAQVRKPEEMPSNRPLTANEGAGEWTALALCSTVAVTEWDPIQEGALKDRATERGSALQLSMYTLVHHVLLWVLVTDVSLVVITIFAAPRCFTCPNTHTHTHTHTHTACHIITR